MQRTLLKSIALGFSIVVLFLIFDNRSEVVRATKVKPPQEKTVEQVGKNIKVLTGMPESQLIPVMNFFAASMGRRCNYCHVNNQGQWDYASDDKPEKSAAREMVKLVMDINKTTERLKLDPVSCYTCHRGRTSPQSIPALPLALPSPPPNAGGARPTPGGPTPGASPQASPAATPALPSTDEIFGKYAAALGGQTAIDKLKSRTVKGTITQANGNSFQFELSQAAPDKFYLLVMTQQGTIERGFNSQVGWEKTARGVREVTGAELVNFKAANGLFSLLKLKEQYTKPPRVRKDKLGDRDVYIVDGTTTENRRMRLYFDTTSGLLLRRTTTMPTIIGIIPDQIDLEDYREADGLKFPFTARAAALEVGNPTSTRTFTELKLNVPVDDSKFNMPPAPKPAAP
ncbi:MAG TPA: c-type cytochrome [Pyrinomonadaceae bacterium]|nr:c-type cytochrome [Pyrinomonadaceae bacterium]